MKKIKKIHSCNGRASLICIQDLEGDDLSNDKNEQILLKPCLVYMCLFLCQCLVSLCLVAVFPLLSFRNRWVFCANFFLVFVGPHRRMVSNSTIRMILCSLSVFYCTNCFLSIMDASNITECRYDEIINTFLARRTQKTKRVIGLARVW